MINGLGIGYVEGRLNELKNSSYDFDFVEINPNNFSSNSAKDEYKKLKMDFDVSVHGSELSFYTCGAYSDLIKTIKEAGVFFNAPWVSEHLSFHKTAFNSSSAYIPKGYDNDNINYVIEKRCEIVNQIGFPLYLENVANFFFKSTLEEEMSFYKKIFDSENRMIFNVNSFMISSILSQSKIEDSLKAIPLESIESITYVPTTCSNTVVAKKFGYHFDSNFKKVVEFLYKHSSSQSVLIQRRFQFNTLESIKHEIETIGEIIGK